MRVMKVCRVADEADADVADIQATGTEKNGGGAAPKGSNTDAGGTGGTGGY